MFLTCRTPSALQATESEQTAVFSSRMAKPPPSNTALPCSVPRIGQPALASARVTGSSSPRRTRRARRVTTRAPPRARAPRDARAALHSDDTVARIDLLHAAGRRLADVDD